MEYCIWVCRISHSLAMVPDGESSEAQEGRKAGRKEGRKEQRKRANLSSANKTVINPFTMKRVNTPPILFIQWLLRDTRFLAILDKPRVKTHLPKLTPSVDFYTYLFYNSQNYHIADRMDKIPPPNLSAV